ncbi:MAG: ABC transporter permease [Micrococcales bacterium]|nr:MAG: ABC transporter permease [Micrococcales bacterium]PIE26937.1 MAG: ABC transporter permease [Micrococcales bacterium]
MFADMLAYLADPAHWSGSSGVPMRMAEHLWYTLLALGFSAVVAVPLGLLIGHLRVGQTVVVGTANVLRALPSLGVMTLLVLLWGLGLVPPLTALVLLGIPPLLAGVYSGIANVDRSVVDAARSMGMTHRQVLFDVEVPNAMPLIVGGLRGSTLQIVATATIAAYVNLGGLGRYIFDGLSVYDYGQVLVGAVLVAVLALILDGALVLLGRVVHPQHGVLGRLDADTKQTIDARCGS